MGRFRFPRADTRQASANENPGGDLLHRLGYMSDGVLGESSVEVDDSMRYYVNGNNGPLGICLLQMHITGV